MNVERWCAVLGFATMAACAHKPEPVKPANDEFVGFGALRGEAKEKKPKEAKPAEGEEEAAVGGEGEKTALSKEQVIGALDGAQRRVDGCLKKFRDPGIYVVEITIDPAGSCTAEPVRAPTRKEQPDLWAQVPGKIDGGKNPKSSTNRCIASAISSVKFPKFEGKPLVVTYPIVLK
ncbi:MAG: hypothetical protein ABI321_05915 [Polyangia bacterium]